MTTLTLTPVTTNSNAPVCSVTRVCSTALKCGTGALILTAVTA